MQTTPYIRATWHGMEWYSYSNFFLVMGFFLSFYVPLVGVPFVDIPHTTAVLRGIACLLIVILQRLESLLEQVSHFEFHPTTSQPPRLPLE